MAPEMKAYDRHDCDDNMTCTSKYVEHDNITGHYKGRRTNVHS